MVNNHPDIMRFPEAIAFATNHIQELLDKKAIVLSQREDGDFFITIFLILKKNSASKFRMIPNMKDFNKYATKPSFKMETLQHILTMLTPNMFMTNIHIVDANLTVHMNKYTSLYLKIYQHIVPPFGYTSSSKMFTKNSKPIITHLRTLGFHVSFYLDDSWHETDTYKESLRTYITTFSVLQLCGFVPNLRKSNLKLTLTLEILGAIVDSIEMCVWLPKKKEVATLELISTTLALKNMSIRHLARVIGKFISCTIACPLGNAYFRSLECLKVCTLNRNEWNWNSKVILNADLKMKTYQMHKALLLGVPQLKQFPVMPAVMDGYDVWQFEGK